MARISGARDEFGRMRQIESGDSRLGRILIEDERDEEYPISGAPAPEEMPGSDERRARNAEEARWNFWWPNGWWGDQEYTPQCVAFAWMHWAEDGPRTRAPHEFYRGPIEDPGEVYRQAQEIDRWPGTNYAGTSVRAGAKVLRNHGLIREYRWAQGFADVVNALLKLGPLVFGTWWSEEMYETDEDGFVRARPEDEWVGGHAWVANGINLNRGYIRCKNSWGREWGDRGYFRLTLADAEYLLSHGGEACLAVPAGGR